MIGYILLDGCADRPDRRLNYTTPLEAAYTPNLDRLSTGSVLGSVVSVGRGIAPESDIAVFNMLGYSFDRGYPGRGVIEAIGAGLDFRDGWLAMRANFASCADGKIIDRRAGRDITEGEARALEEELNSIRLKGAEVRFASTVGYRGVLVIRSGQRLSGEISNTDPAYRRVGGVGAAAKVGREEKIARSKPLKDEEAAKLAAELVNQFTEKAKAVLASSKVNRERISEGKLPANCVLLRDASDHVPKLEQFSSKYSMEGVALVEMPVEIGIAKLLGMKIVNAGDRNDLRGKAELFSRELGEGKVVYVHIKGPDEFGHDGDAVGKKKNIEKIDREFFASILEREKEARIAVSCDHATPSSLKMHAPDPVPLLVSRTAKKDRMRFTERNSRRGSLGVLRGRDVLTRVITAE